LPPQGIKQDPLACGQAETRRCQGVSPYGRGAFLAAAPPWPVSAFLSEDAAARHRPAAARHQPARTTASRPSGRRT